MRLRRMTRIGNALCGVLALLACAVDDVDHYQVFPAVYETCLLPMPQVYRHPQCLGVEQWDLAGACAACLCLESCNTDDDCAAPEDSDVEGRCIESRSISRQCVLGCEGGKACPAGMSCRADTDIDMEVCVWATDDVFVCNMLGWDSPDPCFWIADQAECESQVSTTTPQRCTWVQEQIAVAGDSGCRIGGTRGQCVHVVQTDTCEGDSSCPDGSANVYWRDLGADSIALATIECPWTTPASGTYRACDFTADLVLPPACACGCAP
jgi:hypothetical protein